MHTIRRYFIAGLLLWVPILVTVFVFRLLMNLFDKVLLLLPHMYRPDQLFGREIPGIGLVLALIFLLITGAAASNFFGHKLVTLWEKLLARIPFVRSIHSAVKQVMHTVFSTGSDSFRKVWFIEYPRKGMYSIAFQTSLGFHEGQKHVGDELLTVFVPTTPNPTSGFLMMIPRKDAMELDMSVDEALKFVISLGMVLPDENIEQPTTIQSEKDA